VSCRPVAPVRVASCLLIEVRAILPRLCPPFCGLVVRWGLADRPAGPATTTDGTL